METKRLPKKAGSSIDAIEPINTLSLVYTIFSDGSSDIRCSSDGGVNAVIELLKSLKVKIEKRLKSIDG